MNVAINNPRSNPKRPSTDPSNLHSTEQCISQPNTDRLRLCVVRQRRLAQLPSDTALLVSTKRQRMMQHVVLVNPDGSSPQSIGHADGGIEVGRVNGGRQAVGGIVANTDGLGFILELGNGADRPEDFLLHDLHVFTDAREDGGFNEVSLVAVAAAANLDLGAFLFAVVNVADKC